jgi:hypothetical protein
MPPKAVAPRASSSRKVKKTRKDKEREATHQPNLSISSKKKVESPLNIIANEGPDKPQEASMVIFMEQMKLMMDKQMDQTQALSERLVQMESAREKPTMRAADKAISGLPGFADHFASVDKGKYPGKVAGDKFASLIEKFNEAADSEGLSEAAPTGQVRFRGGLNEEPPVRPPGADESGPRGARKWADVLDARRRKAEVNPLSDEVMDFANQILQTYGDFPRFVRSLPEKSWSTEHCKFEAFNLCAIIHPLLNAPTSPETEECLANALGRLASVLVRCKRGNWDLAPFLEGRLAHHSMNLNAPLLQKAAKKATAARQVAKNDMAAALSDILNQ